jgi:hypothetical protein
MTHTYIRTARSVHRAKVRMLAAALAGYRRAWTP